MMSFISNNKVSATAMTSTRATKDAIIFILDTSPTMMSCGNRNSIIGLLTISVNHHRQGQGQGQHQHQHPTDYQRQNK